MISLSGSKRALMARVPIPQKGSMAPARRATSTVAITASLAMVPVIGLSALGAPSVALQNVAASTTYSIWPTSTVPIVPADPDPASVSVGVRFVSAVDGKVTALRFFKSFKNKGPFTGKLWGPSGQLLTRVAFTSVTSNGWQTARLSTPVAVKAGRQYVASYRATNGHYSADEHSLSPSRPTVTRDLTALAGVYTYGSGMPTSTYQDSNYYVDVRFRPGSTAPAPTATAPAPTTTAPAPTTTAPAPTTTAPAPTTTAPAPTAAPASTTGDFPMGVWLQDPAARADDYKAFGVNTFVGLWNWPNDGQAYAGWAQDSLDALAREGMTAYAGESAAAVNATLKLRNNNRIAGWVAGDEPDMNNVSPATWKQRIDAMTAVQDRPVYANFGKGFGGHDWWYDHISDAERAAWCASVDVPSVDYYGMTDFHEPAKNKGAWTYGRAIDNLEKACPGKPTWSFVEVTQPWDGSANAATPAGIRAAAWNAVIHGADGVEWFIHDFYCDSECGPDAFLTASRWAANRQAVKDFTAELNRYGAVLKTPDVKGLATSSGTPLTLLTKQYNGVTYVFAQADGSYTAPQGSSGTATVTVNGRSFSDSWTPYQVRVYTVQ